MYGIFLPQTEIVRRAAHFVFICCEMTRYTLVREPSRIVYRQMVQNNHVEVLAVRGNEFLRYDGDVVFEEDETLAEAVLSNAPAMQKVYNDETGFKLGMFHLINGHAQICNAATIVEEFDV